MNINSKGSLSCIMHHREQLLLFIMLIRETGSPILWSSDVNSHSAKATPALLDIHICNPVFCQEQSRKQINASRPKGYYSNRAMPMTALIYNMSEITHRCVPIVSVQGTLQLSNGNGKEAMMMIGH